MKNKIFKSISMFLTAVILLTGPVCPINCTAATEGTTQFMALNNDTDTIIEIPEYLGDSIVTSIIISNCSALKSVTIPKSVEWITIESCYALESVSVDEDNENFCSVDGVLYDKTAEKMLYYPSAKPSEIFFVPESVIEVTPYNYFPKWVEEVIVSESVQDMEGSFVDCDNLKSVTFLNDSLNPNYYSSYGDDLKPWYSIGFSNTENIVKVYVPDNKVDVYKEMARLTWKNIDFELIPLSQRPVDLIGDTNLDGKFDASDAKFLGRYLTNKRKSVTMGADINQDSDVNVFDMISMRRSVSENN